MSKTLGRRATRASDGASAAGPPSGASHRDGSEVSASAPSSRGGDDTSSRSDPSWSPSLCPALPPSTAGAPGSTTSSLSQPDNAAMTSVAATKLPRIREEGEKPAPLKMSNIKDVLYNKRRKSRV